MKEINFIKTQCDSCNKKEASIFCYTKKIALCYTCDHNIHNIEKQSNVHQHFQILYPSSDQIPSCDICKERKGFILCLEDRAILCDHCDIPIHTANQSTRNHDRILLTGAKLETTHPNEKGKALFKSCDHDQVTTSVTILEGELEKKKNDLVIEEEDHGMLKKIKINEEEGSSSSSHHHHISEYFRKVVPGFEVQDLLDISTHHHHPPCGISQTNDDNESASTFWVNLESCMSSFLQKKT